MILTKINKDEAIRVPDQEDQEDQDPVRIRTVTVTGGIRSLAGLRAVLVQAGAGATTKRASPNHDHPVGAPARVAVALPQHQKKYINQ